MRPPRVHPTVPLFVLIFGLCVANGFNYHRVLQGDKAFTGTYSPEMEAEKEFLRTQVSPLKWSVACSSPRAAVGRDSTAVLDSQSQRWVATGTPRCFWCCRSRP